MKARGAVANVAAVRLKRLQHKQRRKVDKAHPRPTGDAHVSRGGTKIVKVG